jgi:phytanoyl-CoA dioxygenase PhyH
MKLSLRRKASQVPGGAPETAAAVSEFPGSDEALAAEIERLVAANLTAPDRETERRLLWLRHLAGMRRLDAAAPEPRHPDPDPAALPPFAGQLPSVPAGAVTPGLLRAAILRDGCLLVRGLVDRARALRMAQEIDRSFEERERHDSGEAASEGYYEEFEVHPRFDPYLGRPWIKMGGGVYAADSPTVTFEMIELFRAARLPQLVSDYLGEPALISVHKSTLRKADPSVPGAWHQDGKFMGSVRALNVWLSLSHCGDDAPGLDVVPRRLQEFLAPASEQPGLHMIISDDDARRAAGERGVQRPIFEPGDALLFDDMFLHQTGSDPGMGNPRFAIECWFFGASGFPEAYAPITV